VPKDTTSPFTPGVPVPVDFFVGRLAEVERLRKKVTAATGGQLQIAFLTGERGIGKSSLASFVRHLVERNNQVLGLHTYLGGVESLEEMVRRVFDRLLKASIETAWHEKVKKFFGNHIREVGLFGISLEFGAPQEDLNRLVHDFAPALRNLTNQLKDEKKGIFLILDDINGLAASPAFANWTKSLVDEIATSQERLPLCLMLVGLEERRQSLIELQPSLARVFDLIHIKAWSKEETRTFYKNAFSKAGMTIADSALDSLTEFAGGLPVLAHEIGDAAFNLDADGQIDSADAEKAIVAAADIVGRKHLQPQVFQAMHSTRYRSILRKLASLDAIGPQFQRSAVLKHLSKDEVRVFDNFVRRMSELGVLTKDPERGAGCYKFPNLLHLLYFSMEAVQQKAP